MTDTVWSPYQRAVFDALLNTNSNLVVEAVAGSGKTTTVLKGIEMIQPTLAPNAKIFFGAFGKKIAVEIGAKLAAAGTQNVHAKTMHSVGFAAIGYASPKGSKINVNPHKVADIIAALVADRPDLAGFSAFVGKAVDMAKMIGIGIPEIAAINDVAAWQQMIDFYGLDSQLGEGDDDRMDKAIAMSISVLRRNNATMAEIDQSDMIYLALVNNLRPLQYEIVFIDEAQDLNATRLLLASRMVKRGGRFVAIGDPFQAIYGFTGALADAMAQIVTKFKAKVLLLSVTYRSAKAIVREAQALVPHIQAREGAAKGEVLNIDDAAFAATDFLPTDFILCRNNAPLVPAAFAALRRNIPCRIEGRDIGNGLIALTNKWKRVKTLGGLRTAMEGWKNKEIAKATAKRAEARINSVNDQHDTVIFFIEEAERAKGDLTSMRAAIEAMFEDSVKYDGTPAKPMLTLCSYHKSKGLERPRVFLLDHATRCPSPYATQAWQLEQERNLAYVAITRAMTTLCYVNGKADAKPTEAAPPAPEPALNMAA